MQSHLGEKTCTSKTQTQISANERRMCHRMQEDAVRTQGGDYLCVVLFSTGELGHNLKAQTRPPGAESLEAQGGRV